jgi:hypothetical protein
MGLTPCQRVIDLDSGRREYCVMEERLAKLEAVSDSTVSAVAELRVDMNDRFKLVEAQLVELRRQKTDTELIQSKLDAQGRQIAELRQDMDRRFAEQVDQTKELRSELRTLTRWIVGSQITVVLFLVGLSAKLITLS